MNEKKIIEDTIKYVGTFFKNDRTGHDYFHTMRVYNIAIRIAKKEKSNQFIVALAALLHDLDDSKLVKGESNNAINYLTSLKLDDETIDKVLYIINNQSFKKILV